MNHYLPAYGHRGTSGGVKRQFPKPANVVVIEAGDFISITMYTGLTGITLVVDYIVEYPEIILREYQAPSAISGYANPIL
jgi:hypothetical protein